MTRMRQLVHEMEVEDAQTILRRSGFPSSQSVCKFPGCIAQANTGRDHCTLHYPENVAQRAVIIVTTHLHGLVSRKSPFVPQDKTEGFQRRIANIRDDICAAIKRTT